MATPIRTSTPEKSEQCLLVSVPSYILEESKEIGSRIKQLGADLANAWSVIGNLSGGDLVDLTTAIGSSVLGPIVEDIIRSSFEEGIRLLFTNLLKKKAVQQAMNLYSGATQLSQVVQLLLLVIYQYRDILPFFMVDRARKSLFDALNCQRKRLEEFREIMDKFIATFERILPSVEATDYLDEKIQRVLRLMAAAIDDMKEARFYLDQNIVKLELIRSSKYNLQAAIEEIFPLPDYYDQEKEYQIRNLEDNNQPLTEDLKYYKTQKEAVQQSSGGYKKFLKDQPGKSINKVFQTKIPGFAAGPKTIQIPIRGIIKYSPDKRYAVIENSMFGELDPDINVEFEKKVPNTGSEAQTISKKLIEINAFKEANSESEAAEVSKQVESLGKEYGKKYKTRIFFNAEGLNETEKKSSKKDRPEISAKYLSKSKKRKIEFTKGFRIAGCNNSNNNFEWKYNIQEIEKEGDLFAIDIDYAGSTTESTSNSAYIEMWLKDGLMDNFYNNFMAMGNLIKDLNRSLLKVEIISTTVNSRLVSLYNLGSSMFSEGFSDLFSNSLSSFIKWPLDGALTTTELSYEALKKSYLYANKDKPTGTGKALTATVSATLGPVMYGAGAGAAGAILLLDQILKSPIAIFKEATEHFKMAYLNTVAELRKLEGSAKIQYDFSISMAVRVSDGKGGFDTKITIRDPWDRFSIQTGDEFFIKEVFPLQGPFIVKSMRAFKSGTNIFGIPKKYVELTASYPGELSRDEYDIYDNSRFYYEEEALIGRGLEDIEAFSSGVRRVAGAATNAAIFSDKKTFNRFVGDLYIKENSAYRMLLDKNLTQMALVSSFIQEPMPFEAAFRALDETVGLISKFKMDALAVAISEGNIDGLVNALQGNPVFFLAQEAINCLTLLLDDIDDTFVKKKLESIIESIRSKMLSKAAEEREKNKNTEAENLEKELASLNKEQEKLSKNIENLKKIFEEIFGTSADIAVQGAALKGIYDSIKSGDVVDDLVSLFTCTEDSNWKEKLFEYNEKIEGKKEAIRLKRAGGL